MKVVECCCILLFYFGVVSFCVWFSVFKMDIDVDGNLIVVIIVDKFGFYVFVVDGCLFKFIDFVFFCVILNFMVVEDVYNN